MISRQLAALMWMVIITIAVGLVPTVARAHGGHNHGQNSSSAHDNTNIDAIQLRAAHAGATVAAAAVNASGNAAASCICNGGCCATGFSCCSPALLSASIAYLPGHMNELAVVRPAA